MTKSIARRVAVYRRWHGVILALWILLLAGALWVRYAPVAWNPAGEAGQRWGELVLRFGWLLVWAFFLNGWLVARLAGLRCAGCETVPSTWEMKVVEATGNCPRCGKVLETGADAPGAGNAALAVEVAAYRRDREFFFWRQVVCFAVGAMLLVLFYSMIQVGRSEKEWLDWKVFPPVAAVVVAGMLVAFVLVRKYSRRGTLRCGECGVEAKQYELGMLVATGDCQACGGRFREEAGSRVYREGHEGT